jgi:hypothetical protein
VIQNKLLAIFIILILVFAVEGFSQEISSDELINKVYDALGGKDALDNVQTLKVYSIYPDHGNHEIAFELKRPNLSRDSNGKVIFDGKRAVIIEADKIKSIPASEIADFEIVIAFHFPAFMDHKAEILPSLKSGGKTCQRLQVKLPLGGKIIYVIDPESYLPLQATSSFMLNGKEYSSTRDFSDFRSTEGLMLPYTFTYKSRAGQKTGRITRYEINPKFPDNYFTIPGK